MKIPRREFLSLSFGALAASFASRIALAQNDSRAALSKEYERPLAERLAAYAHDLRYEDLGAATIERVRTLVIDTIGCGVGAWDERPVRACREIALSVTGPATVIGTNRRTTTELAAFANGAAFRYLDFNDTYVGRFAVHPSDNIAACFAVAEAERASASELITAIVIAYEVNCRLVDALDISTRGWDPSVFGLPAVALAAGRLMKLSADQLSHAVNIAINDHVPLAQTRVGALSDWKGIAAAEAGRNAVFAGTITNDSFAPQKFRDPAVLAFMQKIKVAEDPVLTARAGGAVPTRVTATLTDGRQISREVDHAPGFAERPMSRAEVETKFRGNVGKRWSGTRTDDVLKALWALDQSKSLALLLGRLSLQASPARDRAS